MLQGSTATKPKMIGKALAETDRRFAASRSGR